MLSNLATGVTVVAARDGERRSGLTANAVASISLSPPLLMAAVDHTSDTHTVIQRSGRFAVSILREEHESLSRRFASDELDKFDGIATLDGFTGAPILAESLAYLECKVVDALTHGDHTIFIGEVLNLGEGDPGNPLLFFRSAYRKLR